MRPILLATALGLCWAVLACAPSDPLQAALEERGRWDVTLLNWVAGDDGRITGSARVSGPPNGSLQRLTVRVVLLDAQSRAVGREWWTIDLSEVERGGPKDEHFRLPAPAGEIEGLSLERVLAPTPDELPHIPELAGLSASGATS